MNEIAEIFYWAAFIPFALWAITDKPYFVFITVSMLTVAFALRGNEFSLKEYEIDYRLEIEGSDTTKYLLIKGIKE